MTGNPGVPLILHPASMFVWFFLIMSTTSNIYSDNVANVYFPLFSEECCRNIYNCL